MNPGLAIPLRHLIGATAAVAVGILLERTMDKVPARIARYRTLLIILIVSGAVAGEFWTAGSLVGAAGPFREEWQKLTVLIADILISAVISFLLPYMFFLDRWRGSKMFRLGEIGRQLAMTVVLLAAMVAPVGLFLLIDRADESMPITLALRFLAVAAAMVVGGRLMRVLRFPRRRLTEPSERTVRIAASAAALLKIDDPRLAVMGTGEKRIINAYALEGRRPAIVLSDTATSMLEDEELKSVIIHELAHAKGHHGRTRGLTDLLIRYLLYSGFFGAVVTDQASPGWVLALLALVPVSVLLKRRLHRRQESRADAAVLEYMGDGGAMAAALLKMYRYNDVREKTGAVNRSVAGHPDLILRLSRLGFELDENGGLSPILKESELGVPSCSIGEL